MSWTTGRPAACALAVVLMACSVVAGAAHLVTDINRQPVAYGNASSHWVAVGGYTLFLMDDGIHGQELWRTDGTAAGTQLVKDIRPGPAGSNATQLTVVGGVLYFFADDGTNGVELWRSDGTAAGTHIVADINPGAGDGATAASATGEAIPAIGGVLYFCGTDAGGGAELWRSDGTATGTYRVADINPGAAGSGPGGFAVVGSRLFFFADDGVHGPELWISDGTAAGTHLVADVYPGRTGSGASGLTPTSSGVFFLADDGTHGREIYYASGDGSGAHLVADLWPGANGAQYTALAPYGADVVFAANVFSNGHGANNIYRASASGVTLLYSGPPAINGPLPAEGFVPFGGRLLFTGADAQSAGELWVTDGTVSGTHRLGGGVGLVATTLLGAPPLIGSLTGSDGVYFFGYTGAAGSQVNLWRSDGTEAGTVLYATTAPGFVSSGLAQFQGRVYYADGRFGANGLELWSSDGTAAGTRLVADLNPGPADSAPDGFAVAGGRLYFTAIGSSAVGAGPWSSDGTAAGTVALVPAGPPVHTLDSAPQLWFALGNRALFTASDGLHGNQLWASDGTASGTAMLTSAGGGATFPPGFVSQLNSLVLFAADDGVHGTELWATDGTPAGTRLVADINPGSGTSSPAGFVGGPVVLNGFAYFTADDGVHGRQLWRSDGTAAGTSMLVDLSPAQLQNAAAVAAVLGSRVVFAAWEPDGVYWWATDGTAAGTQLVSKAAFLSSTNAAVANGLLYFGGQAPAPTASRGQLWRTDGTAAGTQLVADPMPSASYTAVDSLATLGGKVLFWYCATGIANGCVEYVSDGTAGGTSQLTPDPFSPPGPAGANSSVVLGNQLVYALSTTTITALRVTDGTAAGTHDLLSSPASSSDRILSLAAAGGKVLFTRHDPVLGPSVWRSDGTAAGTALVAVLEPGTLDQYLPYGYVALGREVLFSGYRTATGQELFALELDAPSANDDGASTSSATAVTIPVLANDGSVGAPIDPASLTIVASPANGSASVDGAGRVTYTPNPGFSGADAFTYTVADTLGGVSTPATVTVVVAEPAGASPGTAPPPPPPSGQGGGGGGALDLLALALLAALPLVRRRVA
ncbi:MAG: cadherin-like domain-containing protein [Proteobacteria bacterium]|nr:cadherin-like domain-containing protein [Pseudomonadota bacterium]